MEIDLDTADGAARFTDVAPRNPGLVWTSVTPFGRTGPRCDWRGSDLVAGAGSGVLYTTGHPETPPVVPGGPALLAGHLAAVNAAVGTLVALAARGRTGRGQIVDVSVQEAVVAAACETGVPAYVSDLQHRAAADRRAGVAGGAGAGAEHDGSGPGLSGRGRRRPPVRPSGP